MEYILSDNKEFINFKGRTAFVNNILNLDFTASGFEFSADFCNSSVSININIAAETGLLGIIIDNDFKNMIHIPVTKGVQKITVTNKLNGIHTVKVLKLLEYARGTYEVFSIIFDGCFIQKPKEKSIKFEFYGDSLTCGYGNLCTTRNSPNPFGFLEHGYKTWCALLAEKMNAEISVVSSSGQGVLTDCEGNPHGTIDKYWNMAVPSKNIKWDFSYKPDFVFINIGTNDINYLRNNPNVKMNWDEFKIAAKKLIDGIIKHSPKCQIVLVLGHDSSNPHFNSMIKAYNEILTDYNNLVLFDDVKCNQLGGDWHPNLEDDKMMFETLYSHMKEKLGF